MTELTEHFNRDKAKAGFRGPGCALAPSACPVERALGWARLLGSCALRRLAGESPGPKATRRETFK